MQSAAPPDPPYLRIAAEIRRRIAAGELAPGDRLPSTRQIAAEWGVAMATATKALAVLRQDGSVEAVPRVGVRVAGKSGAAALPEHRRSPRPSEQEPARDRVIRAAIEIADSEGLSAVSMRGVAAKLGLATMSLYRHVKDKDDLVFLMTDAVFAEQRLPEELSGGWRARLERMARLQWAMCRRHPWVAQVVSLTRPVALPHMLSHADWVLASLDGLGLDAVAMMLVHMTLFSYVRGIAINLESEMQAEAESGLTEQQWMDSQAEAFSAIARERGLPTFRRVLAEIDDQGGDAFALDRIFEFGLGPLLDGLALLVDSQRKKAR